MNRLSQLCFRRSTSRWILIAFALLNLLNRANQASAQTIVDSKQKLLYQNWKQLPQPPITPYHGPFGVEARAFVGDLKKYSRSHPDVWKSYWDFKREIGTYDPDKDPRPINLAFEEACIEDWRRMGYNCAYKGGSFTFRSGRHLKSIGMLGAIDQTLWGNNGPPPLQFDGVTAGRKHREGCGSFFSDQNFQAGVNMLALFAQHHGEADMFKVGNTYVTCSWDEVGMRTRGQMDYREPMAEEFRKFLRNVWFADSSPGSDSNGDGRTYNAFTGENLKNWEEVQPVPVSLNWTLPKWKNDGSLAFSAQPDVDTIMFREPARYKLLIDFHRYFTFEFFRRTNEQATKKLHATGRIEDVICYPFTQHFIIWPGANQRNGNSFYWYHRLSPVVNVEHCWPESPVMNLNFAITDRLAPRHRNPVMGWVWFYFGQEGWDMYNGPHDLDRALARMVGHTVDGSHHWLYSPRYRGRDQKQRLQIAYWQNFLQTHYRNFLAESHPIKPDIALLMPDTTGYFYRYFQYPKQDFAWTADAFQQLQYPYDLLTEEEIELGETDLSDYRVLYVVGSEWSTPKIRKAIVDFKKKGGIVFANVDSLTMDVSSGKRIDFLKEHFGVEIQRKYKNGFFPSAQTLEDALWGLRFSQYGSPFRVQGHRVHEFEDPRAWAKLFARTEEKYLLDDEGKPRYPLPRNHGIKGGQPMRDPSWKMVRDDNGNLTRDPEVWKQLDQIMTQIPKSSAGIEQAGLDMRNPPRVRYSKQLTNLKNVASYGEIDTANPVGSAVPIAWWNDEIVGIETDQTVWLGTREGMSLHAMSSRMSAHRGTEPCNPFITEIPDRYEAFRAHSEVLGYAARKAKVTRPVTVSLGRRLPMNLEVLTRQSDDGKLFVVVINHDATDKKYDVTVSRRLLSQIDGDVEAWSMLNEKDLEQKSDGKFKLSVPPWGVSLLMLGTTQQLRTIKQAQHGLNQKDMSVPKYFLDRPELNEFEWVTAVPEIER